MKKLVALTLVACALCVSAGALMAAPSEKSLKAQCNSGVACDKR